jgi:hypothetical protein
VAVWAFLHWRRTKTMRWLIVMCVAVAFGGLIRPANGALLAVALGSGVVSELWREGPRRWLVTLGIALACAAPFALLQGVCNKQITGIWTRLPWTHYGERNDPYDSPSLAVYDAARHSRSAVPHLRAWEEEFTVPAYEKKLEAGTWGRVRDVLHPIASAGLPHPFMLVLVPLAVLVLFARGRWVMVMLLVGFVAVYARHTFFMWHYVTSVAPVTILLVLLGLEGLAGGLPRIGAGVRLIGAAGISALCLFALPQLMRLPPADDWEMELVGLMRRADAQLEPLKKPRSIVLFRFDPADSDPHAEVVYNADVAWPDDAPVIRAHDLGERNRELFAYYARLSPERRVYRYDRIERGGEPVLTYLGTARELSEATR